MAATESTVRKLECIADALREEGNTALAQQVAEVIVEVKKMATRPRPAEPDGGVMTTGEAARLLGVRSINTIKRWAIEGLLEGYRRGGRILVARASVERLVGSPSVADQKRFEAEQDRVWDPFDAGDEPLPHVSAPGRRLWDDASACYAVLEDARSRTRPDHTPELPRSLHF